MWVFSNPISYLYFIFNHPITLFKPEYNIYRLGVRQVLFSFTCKQTLVSTCYKHTFSCMIDLDMMRICLILVLTNKLQIVLTNEKCETFARIC